MKKLTRRLYNAKVSAGFSTPVTEESSDPLNLNQYLIAHPAATFFVRVEGDSMIQAGIFSGDLLIVDRALEAKNGSTVLATLNGEFLVKTFLFEKGKTLLHAANPKYADILIAPETDFAIWGLVTYSIHSLKT